MKFISLSVPPAFETGPQFDENGELINGSWPAGLPHKGIQAWVNIGTPSKGKTLIDMVTPDDWPIGDIPKGWLANGEHQWNGRPDTYDEDGNLLDSGIDTLIPTDYAEYNDHLKDENGNPRTATTRSHVIAGWPLIRD